MRDILAIGEALFKDYRIARSANPATEVESYFEEWVRRHVHDLPGPLVDELWREFLHMLMTRKHEH